MHEAITAKQQLRRVMLQKRGTIDKSERAVAANQISLRAKDLAFFIKRAGTVVAGYWPIASELNIISLLYELQKAGANLCLPTLANKKIMHFRAFAFSELGKLERGPFGIFGPSNDAAILYPAIILLPLLACDKKGHRLGYGGGFYDRYIASLMEKPLLIGVAFEMQLIDTIMVEPHDKILDAVLTPNYLLHIQSENIGTRMF
ncbi:5-formyltetrahydrofolate cyclo-ligase [Bartonella sp. TP]|uniref:5-formyltetrahydrofolate cyclo-ligase n=1 Tax=Bartonella sp. TP TaxID=3057550 RepID=UPI0025AF5BAD|nr:5-formyltetrahydrofolate cyclo-ligase [Bartonella sp. TP]MDN5248483.1 5-formyltetrahydrofolate cyclo-ligase [Alphaproteobacteria bacterium]WJW79592.1 5-formyltetrahydrofolate cyclo-ligase [Bartonella sp. TP]